MKFTHLLAFCITLTLSVSCAREVAVNQSSETASPASSAEVAAPTSAMAAADTPTRLGTFISGEAPTEGMAQIVSENGERYLELAPTFKTSDQGPDLHVILHRSDDVLGSTQPPAYPLQEQDYVILGALQKTSGAQRYAIPADVNLEDFKSAVIWCRQFNATFGVAKFES